MNIVDWDDYVGQFVAVDSVDVRPRVSGYLQSIGFKDGDIVRKAQVLFVIDPRPYQAALGPGTRARKLMPSRPRRTPAPRRSAARACWPPRRSAPRPMTPWIATDQQAAADLLAAQAAVQQRGAEPGVHPGDRSRWQDVSPTGVSPRATSSPPDSTTVLTTI